MVLPPAGRLSIDGVSMVPGQMQLQRMPLVMKSTATARQRCDGGFGGSVDVAIGRGFNTPAADEMFTIDHGRIPAPGKNARMVRCIDDAEVEREIPVFVEHSSTLP